MSDETPHQVGPQIAQLKAERANAEAYGQTDRVAAIDKQLGHLGVKKEAAQERQAAARDDDSAKTRTPQGRSGKPKTQTVKED